MTTIADIQDRILRIGLKDRAAFSALYDATSVKLFGVCLRILKDRAEAEDALQETYIKIWQKADRYSANGYSPMTWLITIARNQAIDKLRAHKAPSIELTEALGLADDLPTPEGAAVQASENRVLEGCLGALDTLHSEAVRGAYLNGDTYRVLSERAGVPINTMRTWLRRSLAKLKECLDK